MLLATPAEESRELIVTSAPAIIKSHEMKPKGDNGVQ